MFAKIQKGEQGRVARGTEREGERKRERERERQKERECRIERLSIYLERI